MSSAIHTAKVEYQDFRMRHDRTNLKNTHWAEQVSEMVAAYMEWFLHRGEAVAETGVGAHLLSLPAGNSVHWPFLAVLKPGIAFKPYLSTQIYEALDTYIAILNRFRLKEDFNLQVQMIVSMDGNDSLKRVERKEDMLQEREEGGQDLPPTSKECIDRRVGGASYFASRKETNTWDEKNWGEISELSASKSQPPISSLWVEGCCKECWQNMKETNVSRLPAKFSYDAAAGMQYGSKQRAIWHRAQYPLALLHIFMAVEKEEHDATQEGQLQGQLAVAYDIACLEDGEGCKCYFNVSNALAAITRHQLSFHRRQAISEFAYFNDLQTYSSLSRFIYGNYKQALGIISTKNAIRNSMREAGITSPQVFYDWLVEEGEYLRCLCQTPPKETLKMKYYLKLHTLKGCQDRLAKAQAVWLEYQPGSRDQTNALETKHRKDCDEYKLARTMVKEASYCKALDKLEALLVSRCFEMARLNVAGTAITLYNEAATALCPPHQTITWEEWATFRNHLIMQQFFRLIHAEEEIDWLHIEICYLLTYICEEERVLGAKAAEVEGENPALVLQIREYWDERARFNDLHWRSLIAIKRLRGFNIAHSKYFTVGTPVAAQDALVENADCDPGLWDEGEDGNEDDEEILHDCVATVMDLAVNDD
ncbi:hypothetical protein EV368DRAFT_66091 [Lentinula lateritia]|nr:hypothetical protein EV368DRAFT_66091 [Lentinula lateritia]